MATKQSTVDFLLDQFSSVPDVRSRKMFGEYALCCDEKVVALVCDDTLFVKPTEAGEKLLKKPTLAPPYPGAKPYFKIPEEMWDDRDALAELIVQTTVALPAAKKKKRS